MQPNKCRQMKKRNLKNAIEQNSHCNQKMEEPDVSTKYPIRSWYAVKEIIEICKPKQNYECN